MKIAATYYSNCALLTLLLAAALFGARPAFGQEADTTRRADRRPAEADSSAATKIETRAAAESGPGAARAMTPSVAAQPGTETSNLPVTTPPAPTAAGLGKYGDVPVGLYTGTPKINIPLFTLEGRTLSLPLSLSYHASGIKVEQRAGATGLGWSLGAGGVITRVKRGLPDDAEFGYIRTQAALEEVWGRLEEGIYDIECKEDKPDYKACAYSKGLVGRGASAKSENDWVDPQPDLFLFNFGGYSGKFVIDGGSVRTIPHQMLKVTYEESSTSNELRGRINKWTVQAPDGTTYIFAASERTQEFTVANTSSNQYNYASSWYLSRIKSATGEDSISLDYTSGHTSNTLQVNRGQECLKWERENGDWQRWGGCGGGGANARKEEIYLERITTARHVAEFTTSKREDLFGSENMQSYDDITIRARGEGSGGERLRRIDLSYSYFEAEPAPGKRGSPAWATKRLRLDSVQIEGRSGQAVQPPFRFAYYGTTAGEPGVPDMRTSAIDHWGFYNGVISNNGENFVPAFEWPSLQAAQVTYPSSGNRAADRSPDAFGKYMQAGTLRRISYPTGGEVRLEFEPHEYGVVGENDGADLPSEFGPENSAEVHDCFGTCGSQHPKMRQIEVASESGEDVPVTLSYEFIADSASTDPPSVALHKVNGSENGETVWREEARHSRSGEVKREIEPGTYELRAHWGSGEDGLDNQAHLVATWRNRVVPLSKEAGGLRIERMVKDSGLGSKDSVVTAYDYDGKALAGVRGGGPLKSDSSSGVLVRRPRYLYYTPYGGFGKEHLYAYSSDRVSSGTGPHVGYRQVTVRRGGSADVRAGETQHFFLAATSWTYPGREPAHDVLPEGNRYLNRVYATSRGWKRGKPLLTRQLSEDGRLLRSVRYEYAFADTDGQYDVERVPALNYVTRLVPASSIPGAREVIGYDQFEVISAPVLKTRKTVTTYDDEENFSESERVTIYEYGDLETHLQPIRVAERVSSGLERTRHIEYAHEEHRPGMGPGGTHQLSQKYSVTGPDGADLSKEWTTWDESGGYYRPGSEYVWVGTGETAPTSPDGPGALQQTTYADYNPYGQPTATISALGQTTRYAYEGPGGRLSKISTTLGERDLTTSYVYDARGLLSGITDEAGGTTSYRYDGLGRLRAVEDDAGEQVQEVEYHYGDPSAGDLSYMRETLVGGGSGRPNQVSTTYVDGLGREVQTQMRLGREEATVSHTSYDALGRPARQWRPVRMGAAEQSYVPETEVAAATKEQYDTERPFTETIYKPDPLGRVWKIVPPGEAPGGAFVEHSYGVTEDGLRFVRTTDEVGDQIQSFTDGFGREVRAARDPGGINAETNFSYGPLGNLRRVEQPEGELRTYAYDARGLLRAKATPWADGGGAEGDPTDEDATAGEADTRYKYDAAGALRFRQNAAERRSGTVHFRTYDGLGRPRYGGIAEATFSELDGTSSGGYAFEESESNWRSARAYDALPSAAEAPWAGYDWEAVVGTPEHTEGRLVATARRVTGGEAAGLPENLTLGGGRAEDGARTYEAAGTLTAEDFTAQSGAEITFRAGERVALKPGFRAEAGSAFHAETDASLKKGASGPERARRLAFYSYDAEGLVSRKHVFAPSAPPLSLAFGYDQQGRLTYRRAQLASEPDGGGEGSSFCWWYAYDARGLLARLYAEEGCAPGSEERRPVEAEVRYTYNAAGQIDSTVYKGGVALRRTYYAQGWLRSIGEMEGSGPFAAAYAYRPDGQVERAAFRQPGSPHARERYRYDYEYDALKRLQGASWHYYDGSKYQFGNGAYNLGWADYDRSGNITRLKRQDQGGELVDDLAFSYDAGEAGRSGRLTGISDAAGATGASWDAEDGDFAYDALGRLKQTPAPYRITGATYDERSLPTGHTLAGGDTVRCRYSAGGERTYRRVGSDQPTRYLLGEGGARLGTLRGNALGSWNLALPSGRVVGRIKTDGSHRYYLEDRLGSVRAVMGEEGSAAETRDYYPFGLRMPGRSKGEAEPAAEDFTGHQWDRETQLLYASARYYMPALARWTTTDPILNEKGAKELLEQDARLLGMSPYNYSYDNPTNLTDPTGKCPWCIPAGIGGGAGAIIGGGLELTTQVIANYNQTGNLTLSNVDWKKVGGATARGAVTGAAAGATGGASLVTSVSANAAAGVAGGAADRAISGEDVGDKKAIFIDALAGGTGGAAANRAEEFVKSGAATMRAWDVGARLGSQQAGALGVKGIIGKVTKATVNAAFKKAPVPLSRTAANAAVRVAADATNVVLLREDERR